MVPMKQERLEEISRAAGARWAIQKQVPSHNDDRILECLEHIGELVEEVVRLRSLQDDDASLLDWASTNFADHRLTITDAVEEDGYSLRDALRGARDGTLADEIYGGDHE